MITITGTYPSGEQVTWEDGEVTPPHVPVLLDAAKGDNALLTPEGPLFPVSEYATNPWAFMAALNTLYPDEPPPKIAVDGELPPLYEEGDSSIELSEDAEVDLGLLWSDVAREAALRSRVLEHPEWNWGGFHTFHKARQKVVRELHKHLAAGDYEGHVRQALPHRERLNAVANRVDSPKQLQGTNDKAELFRQAVETKPEFDELLHRVGDAIGASRGGRHDLHGALEDGETPHVVTAPVKSEARASEKAEEKYKGDWSKVRDLLRGSIMVEHEHELAHLLDQVHKHATASGWRVAGVENRYGHVPGSDVNTGANPMGYRDVSMHLVSPEGHVGELQLNTLAMMRAKEGHVKGGPAGHKLYEDVRPIIERAREKTWTPEERSFVADKAAASHALYRLAELRALQE